MQSSDALEIVRTFDAPRELVWRLWADPAHRVRWWGPEGMALSALDMDFREGGAWRMVMSHPSGFDHPVSGVFTVLREPDALSFSYINESDGRETLVELEFRDVGGRTEMRFRQSGLADERARAGHGWGWNWTFDLFADYARLIDPARGLPVGRPRIDGVAADIAAARERWAVEQQNGGRARHLEAER